MRRIEDARPGNAGKALIGAAPTSSTAGHDGIGCQLNRHSESNLWRRRRTTEIGNGRGRHRCGEECNRHQRGDLRPPARSRAHGFGRHHGRGRAGVGNPLQLGEKIARRLPALVRILGQAHLDDLIERGWRRRIDFRQRFRLRRGDRRHQQHLTLAGERLLPGDHLVQQHAKREDVGPRVCLDPLQLLRRHVLQRAEHRAWRRQFRSRRQRGHAAPAAGRTGAGLRQTEIEELGPAGRQHHVGGFQIPMSDALTMRFVERVGDLDADLQRVGHTERSTLDPRRQRLSLEILHDEEVHRGLRASGRFVSDVVEHADVRMAERGERLRLAFEALPHLRMLGPMHRKHFDRDRAAKARINGLVDFAHATGTERADDFVGAEPRSGGKRRRSAWRLGAGHLTAFPAAAGQLRMTVRPLDTKACPPTCDGSAAFCWARNGTVPAPPVPPPNDAALAFG
jgi:hypothetical protein